MIERRSKLLALLLLVRPANLVTAAADSLTGWVIARGASAVLPYLIAASVCLYAGGVVLNDFFDRKLDAVERPERPLPSGVIPPWFACAFGTLLLIAGVALGVPVGAGRITLGIAGAILLYDAVLKPTALGPLAMALCRALNLCLGLSVSPGNLHHAWPLALIPFVYIAAITTLSRGEVHGGSRLTSAVVAALMSAVAVALLLLHVTDGKQEWNVVPFVLLLLWRVGPPLIRTIRKPEPGTVRGAVHAGIVSLVVLDAAIAAGYGGLVIAAAILSLSIVAAEFGRMFPVT